MCNQQYATEHNIPMLCLCTCGAKFFQCEDDITGAVHHAETSMKVNSNHQWQYHSGEIYVCDE